MKLNKVTRLGAIGVAAGIAFAGVVTNPAHAEPVSASLAVVGSDTLQDVLNALANGTSITGSNVRSLGGSATIGSFDATGSNWIQTKPNGPRFGRPNGSGDGVKALSRSIDGQPYTSGTPGGPAGVTITNQVDIARSSSGATAVPTGALLYVPFGRDALSYAHTGTNAAFDNIDAATLKGLFECTITTIGGTPAIPVIPQAGSGSRKDFIGKIGVTESSLGSCVKVGQEHDTLHLSDGSAFPANAVTPMSAAQWVAQNTGAGIDRRGANAKIGSPLAGVSPVTGTGTAMAPNKAFYDNTTWGRDTYLVVEYAKVTPGDPKYNANLADVISSAGPKLGNTTGLNASASAVKRKFGFLAPSTTTPFRAALA